MPRRSEPPPQAPLAIKEPHDGARSKIKARLQKAKELSATAVQSYEEAEAFERDYQKWNAYNEALLTSLFTNDSPTTEYRWSVRAGVIVGEESAYERHHRRLDEIKAKCIELESLAEKLELIPLAPGVATPTRHATEPDPERLCWSAAKRPETCFSTFTSSLGTCQNLSGGISSVATLS